MGKKKSGKKGGSKKKKGKATEAAIAAAGPTEVELSLRLELEQLEDDIQLAKKATEEARVHNEFLNEEIARATEENAEYEAYIRKKTEVEQSRVTAVTDANKSEVDAIDAERAAIEAKADAVKRELQDTIVARETELGRTRKQIIELRDVEETRAEQAAEIEALEAEIAALEQKHFDELQGLKSQFLQEKAEFQAHAAVRVAELEEVAPTEAVTCLHKTSASVKAGNRKLRTRLLSIMAANKELYRRQSELEAENSELTRQMELDDQIVRAQRAAQQLSATVHGSSSISRVSSGSGSSPARTGSLRRQSLPPVTEGPPLGSSAGPSGLTA